MAGENKLEPKELKPNVIAGLIIVAIIVVSTASVYANSLIYHQSDPIGVKVLPGVTDVFTYISVSASTINEGESVTVTMQLSNGQAGVTIQIKEGSTVVASGVTNAQGIAQVVLTPAVGDHVYVAYPQA